MPNIGFSYNSEEYRFELTWKSYYLNVRPFAIYNGQYYTLKAIIPWLKNNYPNVDYRTAVEKFKNYHRWGFWLEKLPQDVADGLDYLGFDVSDTNIPLSLVELEEVEAENFTFKRIHIGGKFTLDFYDLYERGFEVEVNRTTILVGNVKGKTDLDLDPVTYGGGIITITGYTGASPCTFWDVWNASDANGWAVVNNTCNTQFKFWCKIVVGDGSTPTYFNDTSKQIVFVDGVAAGGTNLIEVKANAYFRIGVPISTTLKTSRSGCHFINLETPNTVYLVRSSAGQAEMYSSTFTSEATTYLLYIDVVWNSLFTNKFGLRYGDGDLFNLIVNAPTYGILEFSGTIERVTITDAATSATYISGATSRTFRNLYLRNNLVDIQTSASNPITADSYYVDVDSLTWSFNWLGVNTGEVYRNYTFNVTVVDKDGNPVENADVTVTYSGEGGGTAYSGTTPANGSIPEQTISKGFYNQTGGDTIYPYEPYNITIEATGYLPQTFIFNVSEPIDWETPLIEAEDGIVIQNVTNFPLEFFAFLIFAGASLYIGWNTQKPDKAIIVYCFSLLFWVATMWQWFTDQGTLGMLFLFLFPVTLCLFFIFEEATRYFDESMKGYKDDPF